MQLAFIIPALFSSMSTVAARFFLKSSYPSAPSLDTVGIFDRVYQGAVSAGYLLIRPLGPWNFTSNRYYFSLHESLAALVYSAVILGVLCALWWLRRRIIYSAVLIGWFLLALPCLGLTENFCWPADRYSYLLDIVWWLALASVAINFLPSLGSSACRILSIVVCGLALVIGALLALITSLVYPQWQNSDELFKAITAGPDFKKGWVQAAHVYSLWARELHESGYPRGANFRFSQAGAIYDEKIIRARDAGDLASAVRFVNLREELGYPVPFQLRRDRAKWNLELGNVDAAKKELQSLLVSSPDDELTAFLLRDTRLD